MVIIVTKVSAPYAKTVQSLGPMKLIMAPGVAAKVIGTNVIKMMMMMMFVVSQEPVHSGSGIQIKLA